MIAYRPDIDGLRAVAVLSVVIYHTHEQFLPGGFTGVDVFFVISGYLITGLVAKEIARNDFSISRFYVRRAKRILPALFTVMVTTLLLGLVLLTPAELGRLGRTMAATASFFSNVEFWQDVDYFDTAAERKPLLHTWSLAVEEQFYFIWPVALLMLAKMKVALRPALGLVIVVSFALSCYAAVHHPPSAFFLLPPRAWELLAGAALALGFVPVPRDVRWRDGCALAGIALIAAGLGLLTRHSPFPGWNALLPCVGAMLIIGAGERGSNTVARRLLEARPMVFVGLISYSLYLWHWPLLSLARSTARGVLSPATAAVLVTVAFVFSVITWRFVERPLRAGKKLPAPAPVLFRYAVASLAIFAVGAYLYSSRGLRQFARPEVVHAEAAQFNINPLSGRCLRWQSDRSLLPEEPCMTGDRSSGRRLVLWGDSHADAVAPGFVEYAMEHGLVAHQLTMAGCPPLVGVTMEGPGVDYGPCEQFNRRVLDYVIGDERVEVVAISGRWPLYTETSRFGRDDPGPITYLLAGEGEERSTESSRRAFSRGIETTVDALLRAKKRVIVLGTIPEIGFNVPDCLARNHMPFSGVQDCNTDMAPVMARLRFADSEIARLTDGRPQACTNFPSQAICRSGRCLSHTGDDILYANDDHLSLPGALFVARSFQFDQCLATRSGERTAHR